MMKYRAEFKRVMCITAIISTALLFWLMLIHIKPKSFTQEPESVETSENSEETGLTKEEQSAVVEVIMKAWQNKYKVKNLSGNSVADLRDSVEYLSAWYNSDNEVYYPITQDGVIWSDLSSTEKHIVSDIPDCIVYKLGTQNLLELVLNYPCADDILNYSNMNSGIGIIRRNCSAMNFLLNREDLVDTLIEEYSRLNFSTLCNAQYSVEVLWTSLIDYVMDTCDLSVDQILSLRSIRFLSASDID